MHQSVGKAHILSLMIALGEGQGRSPNPAQISIPIQGNAAWCCWKIAIENVLPNSLVFSQVIQQITTFWCVLMVSFESCLNL